MLSVSQVEAGALSVQAIAELLVKVETADVELTMSHFAALGALQSKIGLAAA